MGGAGAGNSGGFADIMDALSAWPQGTRAGRGSRGGREPTRLYRIELDLAENRVQARTAR